MKFGIKIKGNKMKKMVIGMISIIGFGSVLNAGMWSTVSGMTMKEVKPSVSYTLDTAGFNPRIYEFDTRTKPIMHCVLVSSSSDKSSAPTLQCIPKNR